MKVLIAEDSAPSRKVLQNLLRTWGYAVLPVENGDDAWEILQAPHAPNLVLLDWVMPGMKGIDICRSVRARVCADPTYVIMLTGKDRKEDIVSALDAGANDYITKPFEIEELRARLQVGVRVLDLQLQLADSVRELQEALLEVKTLRGIIPICMHCHKVRRDDTAWERIEKYVSEHSQATFSHGLCPECHTRYYPRQVPLPDSPERA